MLIIMLWLKINIHACIHFIDRVQEGIRELEPVRDQQDVGIDHIYVIFYRSCTGRDP